MSDRVGISFRRDTRKTDLAFAVQASGDLVNWVTIAQSAGGGDLVGAPPYSPTIVDASDSPIASVGVIRRETVADVAPSTGAARRFLRVRVTLSP